MRMTGTMARRMLAGAFLAVVMTLSLAGIASAASDSNSNSNGNTNNGTGGTTTAGTTRVAATTGAEMWIPLMLGGLVITVAVATRVGLSRAASRTP